MTNTCPPNFCTILRGVLRQSEDDRGSLAEGTDAYELPNWNERQAQKGFSVLELNDKWVRRIQLRNELLAEL